MVEKKQFAGRDSGVRTLQERLEGGGGMVLGGHEQKGLKKGKEPRGQGGARKRCLVNWKGKS